MNFHYVCIYVRYSGIEAPKTEVGSMTSSDILGLCHELYSVGLGCNFQSHG